MKQAHGFFWPDDDEHACRVIPKEVVHLPKYLQHCRRFRAAVQAGGNVGVYAMALARHFDRVHTFEPDAENWACLAVNVTAPNVTAHRAGLTDVPRSLRTGRPHGEATNCGAVRVADGGDVPGVPLDALDLPDLDLLLLDVEGWELPALVGAVDTLARCRPVVACELKGIGDRMGFPEQEVFRMLHEMGYREADRIGRDVVFAC